MYWIDISILVIVLVSTLIAVLRGFVKEAISLATWVAAFLISMNFAPRLSPLMPEALENPLLRQGISLALLFVCTMIVGGLVNFIVSSFVEKTGLSRTDRALGMLFGLVRGGVIICALVLFAAFIELTKADWWQQAKLLPYFQVCTEWAVSLMPEDIAARFIFK